MKTMRCMKHFSKLILGIYCLGVVFSKAQASDEDTNKLLEETLQRSAVQSVKCYKPDAETGLLNFLTPENLALREEQLGTIQDKLLIFPRM